MTENLLELFCLVDSLPTTRAFPINATRAETVGKLKDHIKAHQTPAFDDITSDQLTLWCVSIPDDKQGFSITIDALGDKTELNNPRIRLSKLFPESPDDNTYIIVQRPPQVHSPIPARVSTPLSGYLSDNSRPGTPLSGDLRVDIKKITDKFFAPGSPITDFLDAFVRGQRTLPVTTGPIRGCGKTRAVIELLSQHWGFYFNASSDDWGSSDVTTLHSTVQDYLNDTREHA
ncbi:hypothetical protein BGX33_000568, partial [Mortierella sp. NVP41]